MRSAAAGAGAGPGRVTPVTIAARRDLYGDAFNEALFMRPGHVADPSWCGWTTAASTAPSTGSPPRSGGGSGRLRRTQTGFVRSYALSMLGGSVLVVASLLAVRFVLIVCCVLGLVPLVGAIVVFALPARPRPAGQAGRAAVLAGDAGGHDRAVRRVRRPSASRFQYVTSSTWIRSFGVSFSLGVDGIALVLIALTAVLVPAVVLASWSERDRAVDAAAPATAGAVATRAGAAAVVARATGRAGTTTAVLDRPRDDDDEDIVLASETVLVTDEDTTPRAPGARRGQPKTFFALLLLLEVMMIGVFAATDVFLFYVFFEAMLDPDVLPDRIASAARAGSTRRSSSSSTRCSAGWSCWPR